MVTKTSLTKAAMQVVHSAAEALENSTSAMEQFALGLGYTHSNLTGAWDWLLKELTRQTIQTGIANVQNPQASTLPFHSILAWYWWKKDPAKAHIEVCFDALLQSHRYWYEFRDVQELGLPGIHFAEEGLSPEFLHSVYGAKKFHIQDPAFLGLLCRANECLIELGQTLGKDLTDLLQWHELTVFGLNTDLWDAQAGNYMIVDVDKAQPLSTLWLSNYLPMWAGVPDQEQAERLCTTLVNGFFQENYWVLPTKMPTKNAGETPTDEVVSLLLNRMIYAGLTRYGFNENANYLYQKALQMVSTYGFYARYKALMHPYDNIGLGQGNAVESAAVVLDMASGMMEKRSFEQQWQD